MKLPLSPCEAPYVIRHKSNKEVYIKTARMPPRTCEWTKDIKEAEVFEHLSEAEYCAEFISEHAFLVEVHIKE